MLCLKQEGSKDFAGVHEQFNLEQGVGDPAGRAGPQGEAADGC